MPVHFHTSVCESEHKFELVLQGFAAVKQGNERIAGQFVHQVRSLLSVQIHCWSQIRQPSVEKPLLALYKCAHVFGSLHRCLPIRSDKLKLCTTATMLQGALHAQGDTSGCRFRHNTQISELCSVLCRLVSIRSHST